ncbi:hypothetical protein DPSP01_008744 [Paraphaeosphaeria sporulosa]
MSHSKPQYERVFKKWGFTKRNISKKEWEFIVSRLSEREANGQLHSHVKFHGLVVSEKKIKKQRRNYALMTLERQQLLLKVAPRPVTPPNVEVYTPPVSPMLQAITSMPTADFSSCQSSGARISIAMTGERKFTSADNIPWRQFMQALSDLHISADRTVSDHDALVTHDIMVASSNFENTIEDLFWISLLSEEFFALILDDKPYPPMIHPAFLDPIPYMAPRKDCCADINLKDRYTLSPVGKQTELLKHVVYLLSNNFNPDEIAPAIVEFARDAQNRKFLARLISSGLYTVDAMAEKLLIPAAIGNNFLLIETLIDSGTNINYRGYSTRFRRSTLITYAIESCNEKLFQFLLENGAGLQLWVEREMRDLTSNTLKWIDRREHVPKISLLNYAIQEANFNIIQGLIQFFDDNLNETSNRYEAASFVLAAHRGDVDILELLISKDNQTFDDLRKTPWILYEAAALGGSIPMLIALQTMGLDHCARSYLGQGSPLVYALLSHNTNVTNYLLENGFNIDTYASINSICGMQFARELGLTRDAHTYAPIHAAVLTENIEVLRRFILKGVDPNQTGKRLPIQMAACVGNLDISRVLLEAGACADYATLPYGYHELDNIWIEEWNANWSQTKYHSVSPEQSAIQIALERGDKAMFELLIQYGACLPNNPVKNNAQSALQDILQNHEFSAQDLGVGLAHAAVYLKERVIQAFLDAGSWPDDSVGAHIWPNGYPPLDKEEDTAYQINVLRHTLTIYNHPFAPIIYNHYQKFASRAQEPQLRTHFIQAYAIAIRCGDIHLGQMLAKAVGINAVLYRALPTLVPNEDRCYVSAVRLAVRFKRYDFVDWLLENGAEVEIATNSSHGPLAHSSLQIASKDGKISLVGTLLNKGADVNARPAKYHGATALQFAAMNGHFGIANLLINAGADLTAPPGVFEGRSAIEGAAEAGRMDMASYLLGLGVGDSLKGKTNTNYRRTVFRAWQHGHHALSSMIRKWKAENDPEYSEEADSVAAILRTMTLESLACAGSYRLEPKLVNLHEYSFTGKDGMVMEMSLCPDVFM